MFLDAVKAFLPLAATRSIAAAIAGNVLLTFVFAQEPIQAHIDPPPALPNASLSVAAPMRFDVNLVMVNVAVTDKKSRPVLGLQSQNFEISEGKEQQQIRYFFSEDAPISVGLVVDFSLSMKNKIDIVRDSVREFFNNANPLDEYYVVAVSTVPTLLASGTRSIREIESRLAEQTPTGETALNDSVELVLRTMKHSRYERRAVVIISDGGDTSSHQSLRHTVKLVEEANADVYAIGIFDTATVFLNPIPDMISRRGLVRLTNATGGRTFSVNNAARVPGVVADLSRELRSQYVLAYHPREMKKDGKWRKVKVRVISPSKNERLSANFKKGYYAPLQ